MRCSKDKELQTMKISLAVQYHQNVQEILSRIIESQLPCIEQAGRLVADTIQRDSLVYTFGSGHSVLIAIEMYSRAGGLANFDVIHDKTFGRAERLSGYAAVLLDAYPIGSNDLLIIASNSGRNPLPIEMAMEARKRGIQTIAITSLNHSRSVQTRMSTGGRLCEICDIVIDNCGILGDSTVEVGNGDSVRVGPTSSVAGTFIANCIVAVASRELMDRGIHPPVFVSGNLDDVDERNRSLLEFTKRRLRGL
jgi:uncharacterized phosphosugar-binding protein